MTIQQHTSRKAARLANQAAIEEAIKAFVASGMTHDGSLEPTSTRCIPDADELRIDGNEAAGVVQVVRVMPAGAIGLGHFETKNSKHVPVWMAGYKKATTRERAINFLQVDDPGDILDTQEATLKANGVKTGSAYQPKVQMEAVDGAEGVLLGGTDKVKRVTWRGHGGFSLARAMGHMGLTGSQAVKVFAAIKMPLGKAAIIGGVYSGKKGERGAPAPLTADDLKLLQPAIDAAKVESPKEQGPSTKEKTANKKEVLAISTARVAVQPPTTKMTKVQKDKVHGEKVMAEVAKRKAAKVKRK